MALTRTCNRSHLQANPQQANFNSDFVGLGTGTWTQDLGHRGQAVVGGRSCGEKEGNDHERTSRRGSYRTEDRT